MNKRIRYLSFAIAFSVMTTLNMLYISSIHTVKAETVTQQQKIQRNYKLISTKEIKNIGATVYEYAHVKTGAKILFLKNSDKNKFFQ